MCSSIGTALLLFDEICLLLALIWILFTSAGVLKGGAADAVIYVYYYAITFHFVDRRRKFRLQHVIKLL